MRVLSHEASLLSRKPWPMLINLIYICATHCATTKGSEYYIPNVGE
jgi:hypothetical protein